MGKRVIVTPADKLGLIVSDWRTGEYTQRELADKYKVSNGFVAKHTKGVAQDTAALVSIGTEYLQGLAGIDEQAVSAVSNAVDERTKHIQFFNNAAIKNVQQAMDTECSTQHDYKARAETISKGREVVLGKTPDTAIQINNAPPVINVSFPS